MTTQIRLILVLLIGTLAFLACSEAKKADDPVDKVVTHIAADVEDANEPEVETALTKESSALNEDSVKDSPSCPCKQETDKSKKSDTKTRKPNKTNDKKSDEVSKALLDEFKIEADLKDDAEELKQTTKETEQLAYVTGEEGEEEASGSKSKDLKQSLTKDKKANKKSKNDKRFKREATKASKKSKKAKVSKKAKRDLKK